MSACDAAVRQRLLTFSLSFIPSPMQAGQEEAAKKLRVLLSVGDASHEGHLQLRL